MLSQYIESILFYFILLYFILFYFISFHFREVPTPDDPHAGRLKKRKKKRVRFSIKRIRESIRRRTGRRSYNPQQANLRNNNRVSEA